MNANSELPKLRTGVTWRNPENVQQIRIPSVYRVLTSVENVLPPDALTLRFRNGSPICNWDQPPSGFCPAYTYITKAPLPAAALPVVEPQLPDGISWLGNPLKQADLDAGWRRVCSADHVLKVADVECLSMAGGDFNPLSLYRGESVVPTLLKWGLSFWWFRTKAPLPNFPNPAHTPVAAEKPVEHVVNLVHTPGESTRVTVEGSRGVRALVTLDNHAPEKPVIWNNVPKPAPEPLKFPELPSGVRWINPGTLTPADIGVVEGWRLLCTLDKYVPADAEAFKGTPRIWRPSNKRGDHVGSPCVSYRTKAPIPELTWPELPPGERYFNPQNLTPADLGFGYRPLCTLDERYPADHEYRTSPSGGWVSGLPTSHRPAGSTFGRTYRTKAPVPAKPATINGPVTSGESFVYGVGTPVTSVQDERIATLTAELNKTCAALYEISEITGGAGDDIGKDTAVVCPQRVLELKRQLDDSRDTISSLRHQLANANENTRRAESNAHTQTEAFRIQSESLNEIRKLVALRPNGSLEHVIARIGNLVVVYEQRRQALDELAAVPEFTPRDGSRDTMVQNAKNVAAEVVRLRAEADRCATLRVTVKAFIQALRQKAESLKYSDVSSAYRSSADSLEALTAWD